MSVVRAFIAVELNEDVRNTIRTVETDFAGLGCDIKWVKPENAHLTLKFLGDVKIKKIESISQTLKEVSANMSPIRTGLSGLGVFPGTKQPRVLWVGLEDPDKKIVRLAESVDSALGNIGFAKEKRAFTPHITLGRLRSGKNVSSLMGRLQSYTLPPGIKQTIAHITVFKSTLTSQGPIYEALDKIALERTS